MYNKTPTYKIRQVMDLTGASEFLLRAWELRYSALKPLRTKTGRRLYSETDVLKARALLALTQNGHRVGDIAQMPLSELDQMLKQNVISKNDLNIDPRIKKIMTKANAFKWHEVRSMIAHEKENHEPLNSIHNLIVPLLIEMGRQVNAGRFSIAKEHILSAIIKESLVLPFNKKEPLKNGPRIVFAAPEGDYHDIGLMIASSITSLLRVNRLFLGAHMPKDELAAVCVRYKATHLLVSSTTGPQEGAKDDFLKFVNFLDRNLDSKIEIWLAGKNTQKYSISLARPFKVIDSFLAFENEVKKCLKSF